MRNAMIIVNILLVVMGGLAAAAESETDVRTAYRNESCACQTQECLIDVENRYARQFGGMKTDPIHVTEAQRLMDEAAKCHTDILAKMPAARTNQRRSEDREAERRKIIRQGPGMAAP